MKTYYDVLGIDFDADNIEIERAFRKVKNQKNLSLEELDIIVEAYEVLSDCNLRYIYDKKINKNKTSKKFCKIAVSLGLAASIFFVGYSLKKQSEIEGYIDQIPDDFKVGNFVDKDEMISKKDLKEDFILIEVPDYTDSIDENSKFNRNVIECLSNEKDFGFYIKTSANTEEEMDAIIYRLNAITKAKNWISNYPLYIEFNSDVNDELLFRNIETFNKKLENLNWFGIFVVDKQTYKKCETKEGIKFHLNTNNESIIASDNIVSYSYNEGLIGSALGSSSITDDFNPKIYTKDFRGFIEYNGLNQNDLEEYYIGIDVSKFQGKVNWDKAKDEIDFAILRVCDFGKYHIEDDLSFNDILDPYFDRNLEECKKYNIPYDFYYYPRATDIEGIKLECKELNKYLLSKDVDSKNIRFFIDIERYDNPFVANMLTNKDKKLVDMINTFYEEMSNFNYQAGLYTCESDLKSLVAIEGGLELTSKCPVWCASYGKNKSFYSTTNINEYGEICNYNIPIIEIDSGVNLWGHQITDKGYISGIESNSVDINKVLKKNYDN